MRTSAWASVTVAEASIVARRRTEQDDRRVYMRVNLRSSFICHPGFNCAAVDWFRARCHLFALAPGRTRDVSESKRTGDRDRPSASNKIGHAAAASVAPPVV